MPARWSKEIETVKYNELYNLYVTQNKTIFEIAKVLNLAYQTVYDRLLRLNIKPNPNTKPGYSNSKLNVFIPQNRTKLLAEFFGIMLGDGSLRPTQVTVTLGSKDYGYVEYVSILIARLFKSKTKIYTLKSGYFVVNLGSTKVVKWLQKEGLVFNKVKSQVGIPAWIFSKPEFIQNFLRGFFDTDGSIYRLRFGVQLAFTNESLPLLEGVKECLAALGYYPSRVCGSRVYVTRKEEVLRFFREIAPAHRKHRQRFKEFIRYYRLLS